MYEKKSVKLNKDEHRTDNKLTFLSTFVKVHSFLLNTASVNSTCFTLALFHGT